MLEVPAVPMDDLFAAAPAEPSAAVRERVVRARAAAAGRNRGGGWNGALPAAELDRVAPLDRDAGGLLRRAAEAFHVTARAVVRIHRVARSIADLAGSPSIRPEHVAEALQYRLPPGTP